MKKHVFYYAVFALFILSSAILNGQCVIGLEQVCNRDVNDYSVMLAPGEFAHKKLKMGKGAIIGNRPDGCTIRWTMTGTDELVFNIYDATSKLVRTCKKPINVNENDLFEIYSDPKVEDNDLFFCENSDIKFYTDPINGYNYDWSLNGVNFSTSSMGTVNSGMISPINVCLKTSNTVTNCSTEICKRYHLEKRKNVNFSVLSPYTPSICLNQTLGFKNESEDNFGNYTWEVILNGITLTKKVLNFSTNFYYEFKQAGTYLIKLTYGNKCKVSKDITITVNNNQSPQIEKYNNVVCENEIITYYANPTNCEYAWTVLGGEILSYGGNSVVVKWNNAPKDGIGILRFKATNCALECSKENQITVHIISLKLEMSGLSAVCGPNNLNEYSVPLIPNANYKWSIDYDPTKGTPSYSNSREKLVLNSNNYYGEIKISCEIKSKIPNCTVIIMKTIQVYNFKVTGPSEICYNDPNDLNYHLENFVSGEIQWKLYYKEILLYEQNGGIDFNISRNLFNNSGSYILELRVMMSGMECVTKKNINIQFPIMPPMEIKGDQYICPSETKEYTINKVTGTAQWEVIGGSIITGQGSEKVSIQWGVSGPFEIKVRLRTDYSGIECFSEWTKLVIISEDPFLIEVSGSTPICPGDLGNYKSNIQDASRYLWSVIPTDAGQVITGQGSSEIEIEWAEDQKNRQNAIVRLNTDYCSYSNIQAPDFIVAFKNHEIPKINFNPEQLCAGTSIDFEVSVEGATLYSWDFGDGQSAQSTVNYGKITHQYAKSGYYNVKVSWSNSTNCSKGSIANQRILINEQINIDIYAQLCKNSIVRYADNSAMDIDSCRPFDCIPLDAKDKYIILRVTGLVGYNEYEWTIKPLNAPEETRITSGSLTLCHWCTGMTKINYIGATITVKVKDRPCSEVASIKLSACEPRIDSNNCEQYPLDLVVNAYPAQSCAFKDVLLRGQMLNCPFAEPWLPPVSIETWWILNEGLGSNRKVIVTMEPLLEQYLTFSKAGVFTSSLNALMYQVNSTDTCLPIKKQSVNVEIKVVPKIHYYISCAPNGMGYIVNLQAVGTYYSKDHPGDKPLIRWLNATNDLLGTNETHSEDLNVSKTFILEYTLDGFTCATEPITINPPPPLMGVLNVPSSLCQNTSSKFSYTPDVDIISYFWDFGDGYTSTLKNPDHKYSKEGTYIVKCTVSNKYGCSEMLQKEITIFKNNITGLITESTEKCNSEVKLKFEPKIYNNYLWSNNATESEITVNADGTYIVTVTDDMGCTAKFSHIVEIDEMELGDIKAKDICNLDDLIAYINGPEGLYYKWYIQDKIVLAGVDKKDLKISNYDSKGEVKITIKLEVRYSIDGPACKTLTKDVNIKSNPKIEIEKSAESCNTKLIKLSEKNMLLLDWFDQNNTLIATAQNSIIVSKGIYTVIYSNSDCSNKAQINIGEDPDLRLNIFGDYSICDTTFEKSDNFLRSIVEGNFSKWQYFVDNIGIGTEKEQRIMPLMPLKLLKEWSGKPIVLLVKDEFGCEYKSKPYTFYLQNCRFDCDSLPNFSCPHYQFYRLGFDCQTKLGSYTISGDFAVPDGWVVCDPNPIEIEGVTWEEYPTVIRNPMFPNLFTVVGGKFKLPLDQCGVNLKFYVRLCMDGIVCKKYLGLWNDCYRLNDCTQPNILITKNESYTNIRVEGINDHIASCDPLYPYIRIDLMYPGCNVLINSITKPKVGFGQTYFADFLLNSTSSLDCYCIKIYYCNSPSGSNQGSFSCIESCAFPYLCTGNNEDIKISGDGGINTNITCIGSNPTSGLNDYNFNFNYDGISTGVSIDSFSFSGSDGTLNMLSKSNGELNGSFSMQSTVSSTNFTLYTSNSNFPNSKIIIEGNASLPPCIGNVGGQRSREDIRYNLSIAPNPTDANTTIFYSYHKECKACFIRIFNYNGKEVIQKLGCDPSNKKLLNTSNLSEGVYLVVLEEEGIFRTAERMVISR